MERTITIGFLGCGNVGGGVWKLLNGFADDIAHRTGPSLFHQAGAGALACKKA